MKKKVTFIVRLPIEVRLIKGQEYYILKRKVTSIVACESKMGNIEDRLGGV